MLHLEYALVFGFSILWSANFALGQSFNFRLCRGRDSVYDRALNYMRRGEFGEARALLEKALTTDTSDPDLHELLGDVYTSLRDSDRAIKAYTEALRYEPQRSSSYEKRGQAYSRRKNWDRALVDFSKAIQIQPDAQWCYCLRAEAYKELLQYAKARADLESAYERGLESPTALFLAEFLSTCPDASVRDGRRAIEYAHVACKQTNYKEHRALRTLAHAYAETGQWDEAIRRCKQALELAEGRERTTERMLLELYQCHEPYREFTPEIVSKKRPATAGEAFLFALVKDSMGNRSGAIVDARKAIELNPRFAAAHYKLGGLISSENLSEAINHFSRTLELSPKHVEALKARGITYLYLGKYREALKDAEAALTLDAKDPVARAQRVCAFASCGQVDRAFRELKKWSQEQPNEPRLSTIRGHCYLIQGRLDEAVFDLTVAIRRFPGDILAYANRAVALSALGREKEARQDLEKCSQLSPSLRAPTEARMRAAKQKQETSAEKK